MLKQKGIKGGQSYLGFFKGKLTLSPYFKFKKLTFNSRPRLSFRALTITKSQGKGGQNELVPKVYYVA